MPYYSARIPRRTTIKKRNLPKSIRTSSRKISRKPPATSVQNFSHSHTIFNLIPDHLLQELNNRIPFREPSFDIYYINLNHRTDRKNKLESQLAEQGLLNYAHRYPAKTPADINIPIKGNRKLKGPEIACYMSHMNTYETFLNNSIKDYALILEDDTMFTDSNWVTKIEQYLQELKECNVNFDVLYLLRYNFGHSRFWLGPSMTRSGKIYKPQEIGGGTSMLLITKPGARKLINYKNYIEFPIDVLFQEESQKGNLICLSIKDFLSETDFLHDSDITMRNPH